MDSRVRKTIHLLSSDLKRDLSLTNAAGHVNLSVSRLRHLFKKETGMSVVQYVKRLRLKKAKDLIESSRLSIKQVMVEVGIKDKSNFTRDFKKTYGLSPAQCRKDSQLEEYEPIPEPF